MTQTLALPFKRVLEPQERISEVLFGLIMVLTFTGSLSIAEAGRDDIRVMLIGALGCNLAWGLIDGLFYLMGGLAERGRTLAKFHAFRQTTDSARARQLIVEALPDPVAAVLRPEELAALEQRLRALPEPLAPVRFRPDDWRGALGVFLLVVLCTFPVVLPFVFMEDLRLAMRASNSVAIAILFVAGIAYGRVVGRSPWLSGILMVVLGLIVVGLTIALGG